MPVPFEPLLARAHAHALDYLEHLPERYVGSLATRDELIAALRAPLPQHGEAAEQVLDLLASQVPRGTTACNSPRYFGFVIGGATPVSLATDWLVSTWDQNAGIFVISPFVAVVEEVAGEWLLDAFDLPRESGVGFVTGCQMANMAWTPTASCWPATRPVRSSRRNWRTS